MTRTTITGFAVYTRKLFVHPAHIKIVVLPITDCARAYEKQQDRLA